MTSHVQPYGDREEFRRLPYDLRSVDAFRKVASMIRDEDETLIVEHVGSTAVPGCPGKGFIDLLVLASTESHLALASGAVQHLGFEEHDFGQGYPGARGLIKCGGAAFRIHIQLTLRDSPKAHEMIAFRELLRSDPGLVVRYAERKQALISLGIDRNPEYTNGKNGLIRDALQKSSDRIPDHTPRRRRT